MSAIVHLSSLLVSDQSKAHAFYTEKLGMKTVEDMPLGEHRWLTVGAANGEGGELVLEPLAFPPAATYQKALYEAGIPATALHCPGLEAFLVELEGKGVTITSPIAVSGPVRVACIDDECGNLIQLFEPIEDAAG